MASPVFSALAAKMAAQNPKGPAGPPGPMGPGAGQPNMAAIQAMLRARRGRGK